MRSCLILGLLAALTPGSGVAQVRDVISKEIAVARAEATLALELEGGRELEIAFRDGVVRIDGAEAGRFVAGSGLEEAWRELLGRAVALEDGPLARALADWEPPSGLDDQSLALARRIDAALESALRGAGSETASATDASTPEWDRLMRSLLERTDHLAGLGEALEGLRLSDLDVRVGEDVVVGREVQLDATLVAVDSDVEVQGTVRGDVVVVDGTLRVTEGGRITGDVRLADSRLLDREGDIDGSVVEVEAAPARVEVELRDRLREELRRELREEIRSTVRVQARSERDEGWGFLRPFRAFGQGLAGVLGVLLNTAVVALLGWGVVFFVPDNVAVVTDTVRRSPGRSAVVGLAGAFLLLPAWILGGLALVLTVVGIFALPFWIALFPLAVAAAVGLGFFGVAGGVGEHLDGRRYPFLDWVRASNPYTLVTGGVVVLAAPFLLANVVEMAVILGFLEGLLTFVGWLAILAAVFMGFGAVLITRGGRRPDFYRGDPFDDDPDWTDGPLATGPRGGPAGGDDWFGAGSGEAAAPDRGTPPEADVTTAPEETGGRAASAAPEASTAPEDDIGRPGSTSSPDEDRTEESSGTSDGPEGHPSREG